MRDGLILLLGGSLLAVPGVLVPASLRVRGWVAAIVAGLVTAAAVIVLGAQALSVLHALQTGWMLLFQAVAAILAWLWWRSAGAPRPELPPVPGRDRVRAAARAHPAAAGVVALAAVALAVQAVMAVAVAPNNFDSMTYHLARIAYWLQLDSVLHFDGGTRRQLGQPPNGEFLQAWTFLMAGTDRLAALVQWVAAAGLAAVVALGARELGAGRAAAAFAAALWVMLPQPLLQATTTQNDLIASFLVVSAAVFAVRGLRWRHVGELVVAGAAVGLAVGTKGTALIALPSLGLLALAAVVGYRPPRALVIRGAAAAVAGLVVLGSFNYVLNQDTFGDPLAGLREELKRTSPVGDNLVRVGWTFVDTPGTTVDWLNVLTTRPANAVFGDLRNRHFPGFVVDSAVHEDYSAYGLFGLFVFLPVLAVVLVRRRSPPSHRAVAGAALLFLVAFAVTNEYNPWLARVMMPGLALGAPLLALLYRPRALRATAIALAVVGLFPSVLVNAQKLILVPTGQKSVFSLDRSTQQTLTLREMKSVLDALGVRIDPSTPIGLVRGRDTWDYVLFGPNRTRRVEPLRVEQATEATMRAKRLGAIVFANVDPPPRELNAEKIGSDYWFVPGPALIERRVRPVGDQARDRE